MVLSMLSRIACFAAVLSSWMAIGNAQTAQVPKPVPVPRLQPRGPVADPMTPAAREVRDERDHLTFHLPNGWNLATRDGELSTFRLDARSAPHRSELRTVASLAFNPYPQTTFASALFYVSSTPRTTAVSCALQTAQKPFTPLPPVLVDDMSFKSGKDEHGHICTEARDVAYTALRGGACLRFDLVLNNFCGGEVSGAQNLTEAQLAALFSRLESIVKTVRFVPVR